MYVCMHWYEGEAAAKESSALKTDAFDAVKAMVVKMNEINEQVWLQLNVNTSYELL